MSFVSLASRLVVVGALTYAPVAYAAQIILDNSSFNTLPASGLPNGCGAGCAYNVNVPIAGWTMSGSGVYGQVQPGTADGTSVFFSSMPAAATSAVFTFGPSLSQVIDVPAQVGTAYTLTVSLGEMSAYGFAGGADLLVNGVKYAATGTAPSPGGWSTFSVTYVGLAVDMGDAITVQLTDPGGVASFTDVQLTGTDPSSAVPEPRFLAGFGMAMLILLAVHRRKACFG